MTPLHFPESVPGRLRVAYLIAEAIDQQNGNLRPRVQDRGDGVVYIRGQVDLGAVVDALLAAAPPIPSLPRLTSTRGLAPGDVLQVVWAAKHGGMCGWQDGDLVTVIEAFGPGEDEGGLAGSIRASNRGDDRQFHADRFAFVSRPTSMVPPEPRLWWNDGPILDAAEAAVRKGGEGPLIPDYREIAKAVLQVAHRAGYAPCRPLDPAPVTSDT